MTTEIENDVRTLKLAKKSLFDSYVQSNYTNRDVYNMFRNVSLILDKLLTHYPQYFPYQPYL